jgi:hypothetical protein
MTQEEQLRVQRQALNAALNSRDVAAATSFLHPDFRAMDDASVSGSGQHLQ